VPVPLDPVDHLEILNLLARYVHAIDLGTPEQWADCFTDDAEFDARPVAHCRTRAELIDFCTLVAGNTRHWTSNTWIEGDGERATARSFLLSLRPGRSPQPGPTAVYHDRLRKTPDGWRIEYRKVEFEEPPDWPTPVS
jgi:hypothetical protein